MVIYLALAAMFSLVVAIFAVQNPELITIKFLFWQLTGIPQVAVILGAAVAGMIAAFFLTLSRQLKTAKRTRELKETILQLQDQLNSGNNIKGQEANPNKEKP